MPKRKPKRKQATRTKRTTAGLFAPGTKPGPGRPKGKTTTIKTDDLVDLAAALPTPVELYLTAMGHRSQQHFADALREDFPLDLVERLERFRKLCNLATEILVHRLEKEADALKTDRETAEPTPAENKAPPSNNHAGYAPTTASQKPHTRNRRGR